MGNRAVCCIEKPLDELRIELGPGIVRVSAGDLDMRKKVVDCAAASFAGTDHSDPEGTLDWVLGPHLAGKWDDPRRLIMMEWMMRLGVMNCLDASGGFILAAPLETGELGAVCIVLPRPHGHTNKVTATCRLINLICKGGLPPLKQMGDAKRGIEKRFECLQMIEELQKKHVPGAHIYLNIMAVHPDAQGKGLCGKLMRQVNVYADKQKLPLYLETSGETNVSIYKRFGYKVVEHFTVECKTDPDGSQPHTDEFAMLRPAQSL